MKLAKLIVLFITLFPCLSNVSLAEDTEFGNYQSFNIELKRIEFIGDYGKYPGMRGGVMELAADMYVKALFPILNENDSHYNKEKQNFVTGKRNLLSAGEFEYNIRKGLVIDNSESQWGKSEHLKFEGQNVAIPNASISTEFIEFYITIDETDYLLDLASLGEMKQLCLAHIRIPKSALTTGKKRYSFHKTGTFKASQYFGFDMKRKDHPKYKNVNSCRVFFDLIVKEHQSLDLD